MDRLLAWIGKLVGTVLGGPGTVVLGDPGLDAPDSADDLPTARMRTALLFVGIVAVLVVAGLPLALGGAIVLIGLLFIFRPRWIPF